jgi:hypothetical protein
MAVIQTDSTAKLSPLNGTILAGISDLKPSGQNNVKLWERESRIVSSSNTMASSSTSNNSAGMVGAPSPTTQGEPSMNNNTTLAANEVPPTSSRLQYRIDCTGSAPQGRFYFSFSHLLPISNTALIRFQDRKLH